MIDIYGELFQIKNVKFIFLQYYDLILKLELENFFWES